MARRIAPAMAGAMAHPIGARDGHSTPLQRTSISRWSVVVETRSFFATFRNATRREGDIDE
jgi:hypothetical protein